MVKSAAYPSLERKPGGPDNWVEQVGGLPKYIERIAKHLHYEKGMSIQHAIATAVNTVKRWARKGKVAKYGDPHNMHVTGITQAQAAAAVAEWEAKKASARALPGTPRGGRMGGKRRIGLTEANLGISALADRANAIDDPQLRSQARARILELATFTAAQRKRLAGTGAAMSDGSFPINNASDLRNAIRLCGNAKDPAAAKRHIMQRARALGLTRLVPSSWTSQSLSVTMTSTMGSRRKGGASSSLKVTNTLGSKGAGGGSGSLKVTNTAGKKRRRKRSGAIKVTNTLGSRQKVTSLAVKRDSVIVLDLALTKDGRTSYKGIGNHKPKYKFRHGFVPITSAAVTAKAKGSPIARKRIERLYGGGNSQGNPTETPSGPRSVANAKGWTPPGTVSAAVKGGGKVTAKNASQLRGAAVAKAPASHRPGFAAKATNAPGGGGASLARKDWASIPDAKKTIRNGKKYVLTEFNGQMKLVPWTGPQGGPVATPDTNIQVGSDLRTAQSKTATELRSALKTKGKVRGKQARSQLNAVLKQKAGKR